MGHLERIGRSIRKRCAKESAIFSSHTFLQYFAAFLCVCSVSGFSGVFCDFVSDFFGISAKRLNLKMFDYIVINPGNTPYDWVSWALAELTTFFTNICTDFLQDVLTKIALTLTKEAFEVFINLAKDFIHSNAIKIAQKLGKKISLSKHCHAIFEMVKTFAGNAGKCTASYLSGLYIGNSLSPSVELIYAKHYERFL